MNKLSMVIAAIILPFFYSIGCEHAQLGPDMSEYLLKPLVKYDVNGRCGDLYSVSSKAYTELINRTQEVDLNNPNNMRAFLQQLNKINADMDELFPVEEVATQNFVFSSASSALLAGIVLAAPIILQVPAENWDAVCALAYQTQDSYVSNGFVLNKMNKSYIDDTAILAEGKLNIENGKIVLDEAKIYKPFDNGDKVQVPTYRHDRWWYAVHQKNSDWVQFLPMPKDQEKRLVAEVKRINKVEE